MTTKWALQGRWKQEPWASIIQSIHQFGVDETYHGTRHSSNEILSMLEGLPFREEVPGGRDLRGAPLAGAVGGPDFDFSGWDFSYSYCGMNFLQCDLSSACFDGARVASNMSDKINRASFRNANLRGTNILESQARECCFDNAVLVNVYFHGTDLTGSSFRDANATGADFTRASLIGCDFRNAKLDSAVFAAVRLDKLTDLRGASLINIYDQDDRDFSGNLINRGTDWRCATYDDSTRYGEDPTEPELRLIKAVLTLLRLYREPEAKILKERFQKVGSTLRKNFRRNWLSEVIAASSPAEQGLLDKVMAEAYRNM